jgi:hypothetical protein
MDILPINTPAPGPTYVLGLGYTAVSIANGSIDGTYTIITKAGKKERNKRKREKTKGKKGGETHMCVWCVGSAG